MATLPYAGSGPYCYSYCLSMMLGQDAPSPAVIEFATFSPFGMQIIDGLPFFDPEGWDLLSSLDKTMDVLGWSSSEFVGKTAQDAITKLKQELKTGPIFVGPVDMSKLSYQPGFPGADHYIIVLSIDDLVHVHDPAGLPYAALPIKDFMSAWGTQLPYGQPFTMRFNFEKLKSFTEEEIISRTLPEGRKFLSGGDNRKSANSAASMMSNLHPGLRGHLTEFAIRVGARRVSDAATCLSRLKGYEDAAKIFNTQAKLIGSLQYFVRIKDSAKAEKLLKDLGETYEPLQRALDKTNEA